LEHKLQLC